MMFDEEINNDEIEDLSVANFLAITNKAYNLYLNQEIEDLDITIEQIPFIIELDKKESISKKELAKYLFLSDRNTARGLMELYSAGIIDRKPLDKKSYDKNGANDNEEIKRGNDFNFNLKISLTPYGKELASKIKEIDAKWEELIYKNLEDSNKDGIMKNVKDLAISSLKINKDSNVSDADTKISRAKKFFDRMLSRMFTSDHKYDPRFNPKMDHMNESWDNFRDNFGDCFRDDFNHDYNFGCSYGSRNREMYGSRFDDFNRSKMNEMPHGYSERRFRERIPDDDDAIGYMALFKTRKLRDSWPFR